MYAPKDPSWIILFYDGPTVHCIFFAIILELYFPIWNLFHMTGIRNNKTERGEEKGRPVDILDSSAALRGKPSCRTYCLSVKACIFPLLTSSRYTQCCKVHDTREFCASFLTNLPCSMLAKWRFVSASFGQIWAAVHLLQLLNLASPGFLTTRPTRRRFYPRAWEERLQRSVWVTVKLATCACCV